MIHKYWCGQCSARLEYTGDVCDDPVCLRKAREIVFATRGPASVQTDRLANWRISGYSRLTINGKYIDQWAPTFCRSDFKRISDSSFVGAYVKRVRRASISKPWFARFRSNSTARSCASDIYYADEMTAIRETDRLFPIGDIWNGMCWEKPVPPTDIRITVTRAEPSLSFGVWGTNDKWNGGWIDAFSKTPPPWTRAQAEQKLAEFIARHPDENWVCEIRPYRPDAVLPDFVR